MKVPGSRSFRCQRGQTGSRCQTWKILAAALVSEEFLHIKKKMLLIIGIKGMEDQAMLKLFLAGLKPRLWIPIEMLGLAADKPTQDLW